MNESQKPNQTESSPESTRNQAKTKLKAEAEPEAEQPEAEPASRAEAESGAWAAGAQSCETGRRQAPSGSHRGPYSGGPVRRDTAAIQSLEF